MNSTTQLTDSVIRKTGDEAKASGKRLTITDKRQQGLRINLMPSGTKSWFLNCRPPGSKRTDLFALGRYPAIGISEARQAARTLREQIRQGSNPKTDRRRATMLGIKSEVHTLRALCEAYSVSDDVPPSWAHSSKRIYRVFGKMLDLPLSNLKSSDIQISADLYAARASANFAVRTLRPVLKWAAIRGYVPKEMSAISCKQTAKRDRVLSIDELTKVLSTLRSSRSMYTKAMMFLLWTMTRRNETANARWQDVDLETQVLTVKKTKSGIPLIMKLPQQAVAFLKAHKPEAAKSTDLIFPSEKGTILSNWDRATKSLHKASGTTGWHRHDLRRTGATMLGEMGYAPHVIEATLNHTSIHSALASTYNKSRYSEDVAR